MLLATLDLLIHEVGVCSLVFVVIEFGRLHPATSPALALAASHELAATVLLQQASARRYRPSETNEVLEIQ